MGEFQQPKAHGESNFVIPEREVDAFIWAREEQETLLGRALTLSEEKELWETGTVTEGVSNAS